MKNIFKLMLLLVMAISFQACSDDDNQKGTKLEVTPNNIAGVWKLQSWSGADDLSGVEVYLELIRKDRLFNLYEKGLSTMYPTTADGTFTLSKDYYKGDIITIKYNVPTEIHKNDYRITALDENKLVLVLDGTDDTSVYERVDEVPAEFFYSPSDNQ